MPKQETGPRDVAQEPAQQEPEPQIIVTDFSPEAEPEKVDIKKVEVIEGLKPAEPKDAIVGSELGVPEKIQEEQTEQKGIIPEENKKPEEADAEIIVEPESEAGAPEKEEAERSVPEQVEKKNEETREQKRERAIEILSDPKVMDRSPEEIAEAFRNLTEDESGNHRHLAKERSKMVEKNLKDRHTIVIKGKDAVEKYRQQIIQKEEERISKEEHSKALNTLWERNPNVKKEDREKHLAKFKKNLRLDGVDDNAAFDKLINDGYAVEKSKTGWFSGETKIPKVKGKGVLVYGNKKDILQDATQLAKSKILGEAQIRADLKIIEERKRLLAERAVCTKDIIEQTVEKYNLEKQQKQEAELQIQVEQQEQEKEKGEPEKSEKKAKKLEKKAVVKKSKKKSKK